jgi:hypothetical protein
MRLLACDKKNFTVLKQFKQWTVLKQTIDAQMAWESRASDGRALATVGYGSQHMLAFA